MQALVLTHELTRESDFDTYLARTLHPVRPLLSFGRSAKAWPQCEASVAVFCWWRDRGLSMYVVWCDVRCACCFTNNACNELSHPPLICLRGARGYL